MNQLNTESKESNLKPDPKRKIEKSEGAKLNDKSFGELINIIAHCTLEGIDEIVPFDNKTDEQREELLRVAMKSLEVASVITCKFFDSETFDVDAVAEISEALAAKNYEKANVLLGRRD